LRVGVKEVYGIVLSIQKLQKAYGKIKRTIVPPPPLPENIVEAVRSLSEMRLREILKDFTHDKLSRDMAVSELRSDVVDKVTNNESADFNLVVEAFNKIFKDIFRSLIFEENIR
jgi:polyribonucleotide nucleotidyltransferase